MGNPHPKTDHLKKTQWKSGQSGNPAGSKPGRTLTEVLKKLLVGKYHPKHAKKLLKDAGVHSDLIGTLDGVHLRGIDIQAVCWYKRALKSDAAFKELISRVDGLQKQEGSLLGDIQITIKKAK